MRVEPNKLDELLHPVFDKDALKKAQVLTRGLPALSLIHISKLGYYRNSLTGGTDNVLSVIHLR